MDNKTDSSIKKVLLNSGIYSITSILQKGIGFILLPIYTLYLTPKDFGITGVVNSFLSILTLLFTLSLDSAVQRYYHVYKYDKEKTKRFSGTIITFVLLNSIFLCTIIIIFQNLIISPFVEGITFYPFILLGVLTAIFSPIYSIYQGLLQTMQKGKVYAINSLLHFTFSVMLNIIFIVVLKWGAIGLLFSNLIIATVFGLYSLVSLYRSKLVSYNFNFSYLKEALHYSVPLIPHLMSSSLAILISQLFLNNQVSTGSAGLFNVAARFMFILDTFHASVNSAYIPWFYGEMNNGSDGKEQIIKFADFLSKIYLILSVLMSFIIKEVIQIFLPDNYLISWTIIPLMLIAYQFKSIYLFYVNTLFYNTKATKYIFIATVSGSLINIVLSASLTSRLGLLTPAIAILAQWAINAFIIIILSRIIEPVNLKLKKMILYVFLMILAISIGQYYDIMNPMAGITITNLLYKLVIFILVFFIVMYKELPTIKEKLHLLFNKYKVNR